MGRPADEDEQAHRRADRDGRTPGGGRDPVGEICRKLGVSEQSFYRWKKRFGALGVSELRELRQLREEHRKLKGLVADLSLDKMISTRRSEKMIRPAARRALVQ